MSSKLRAFRGVQQGTVVGQEGLEYYYDRYLRGKPGVQRVEVDAAGYPVPSEARRRPQPEAGHSLKVTLDLRPAAGGRKGAAGRASKTRVPAANRPPAAAFVAIDPRNGEVLAIGSYPSFDPNRSPNR